MQDATEERSIQKLTSLGARFERRKAGLTISLNSVGSGGRYNAWTGSASDLKELCRLGAIHELNLSLHFSGPEDLAFLPSIRELRHLDITSRDGRQWNRKYLSHIAKCRDLEKLSLFVPRLPDSALDPLTKLDNLVELHLTSLELSRVSLKAICQIRSLHTFGGLVVDATDADLRQFVALRKLRRLRIKGAGVTDQGRQWLLKHHPSCKEILIE
jgi:hypothetical protein